MDVKKEDEESELRTALQVACFFEQVQVAEVNNFFYLKKKKKKNNSLDGLPLPSFSSLYFTYISSLVARKVSRKCKPRVRRCRRRTAPRSSLGGFGSPGGTPFRQGRKGGCKRKGGTHPTSFRGYEKQQGGDDHAY